MEQILLDKLQIQEVFPVLIKWKNILYYAGHYYDEMGNDKLFHSQHNIECFSSLAKLTEFCSKNCFKLDSKVVKYDFDIAPTNPIDYKDILDKWNLLNTISESLNIFFEGNERKYDNPYHYLFSCCFAINPLPPTYRIPNNYFCLINKVFNKQNKILNRTLRFNNKSL